MAARLETFLSSSTKDLLVLRRPLDNSLPVDVDFLHRSVYDFLCTNRMQQVLLGNTPKAFHTGRIIHLMDQAKMILAAGVVDYGENNVRAVAQASLGRPHLDLNSYYAASFEPALMAHVRQDIHAPDNTRYVGKARDAPDDNNRNMDACIASLIAGGAFTFATKYYHLNHPDHVWALTPSTCFAAALGLHPTMPYGLQHVNVDFLRRFRAGFLGTWDVEGYRNPIEHDMENMYRHCGNNVMQHFCNKWATEAHRQEQDYDSKVLPVVWEIVKLFLDPPNQWLD
ncbi:hypothetical protein CLAFUR4_14430, partial [Fulvia fulva]